MPSLAKSQNTNVFGYIITKDIGFLKRKYLRTSEHSNFIWADDHEDAHVIHHESEVDTILEYLAKNSEINVEVIELIGRTI